MSTRIGIITKPIDQRTSGSCNYLRQLVDRVLDINTAFDIHLVHFQKNELDIYRRAPEVIVPDSPVAGSMALRKHGFALIHFSPLTFKSPIWVGNTRKVASILGSGPRCIADKYSRLYRYHDRFVEPWLARQMEAVITCSEDSRDLIVSSYGVDRERVTVVYASTGSAFRRLPESEIAPSVKSRHGIEGPFLLHVSKYSERKNPIALVGGFGRLLARYPEHQGLQLVLAGSGWQNPRVADLMKEHGVTGKVVFTDYADEADIVVLLNLADIFIFPSLYEGFGMPNIEAMRCECPVITSQSHAIPEVVGDAALLLDNCNDCDELADNIHLLLTDASLRQRLVEKGKEHVKTYSWTESARRLLRVYKSCLEA